MKTDYRHALRTAEAIRAKMEKRQADTNDFQTPDYEWSRLKAIQRQLRRARQRGWWGAVQRLHTDLLDYLTTVNVSLNRLHATLVSQPTVTRLPSEAELCRELLAVEQEFEEVGSEPKTGRVSVTVGPIVLEEIDLGRFEIVLDWECSQPYRVVALDPHPAASNDSVTHPHVQDERLCEGDGRAAIRAALTEGRLADFFLIVGQTLSTYGKGSAYVELDRWRGEPCAACGDNVDDDSRYCCQRCSDVLCDACSQCCGNCESTCCSGCLSACAECGSDFCSSCLSACTACGGDCCADCLTHELCEECYAKRDDKRHESVDASAEAAAERAAAPTVAAV